jgi:hypothetical protein
MPLGPGRLLCFACIARRRRKLFKASAGAPMVEFGQFRTDAARQKISSIIGSNATQIAIRSCHSGIGFLSIGLSHG